MLSGVFGAKHPYGLGRFTRQENGLVYFYKTDVVSIDKAAALEHLENVRALDDTGQARVIVVQGHQVEYTFEAQYILMTNALLSGLAFVSAGCWRKKNRTQINTDGHRFNARSSNN